MRVGSTDQHYHYNQLKEEKKKRLEIFLPVAPMSIIQFCGLQQWHLVVVVGLQKKTYN